MKNRNRPVMTGSSHVLSLYRQLLRKGQGLKLTNKEYFFNRVQTEFRNNKRLHKAADIKTAIEKAETFLKNDRLV
ncbi:MIEF1 upstream open reading frame protein-like isoform X2 [Mya arenaria]|uniref:MIEF1 upstream open reading frame protein-like isoform X2 n=1 Tax=Mya arenaria TaxID=6604 RepID=UPI0022E04AE5|nr:MIEF1 upstream open reading frame protein-like isoform X2 [Mya arenaria]